MIQVDPSAVGGRSPHTPDRDVGFRCDMPQPECMVYSCGIGPKEGLESMLLHRLLPS